MRLSSRKGLELAMSTFIVIIVSLMILGSALYMTRLVFCQAEDYAVNIDRQSERRIEELMSSGAKVAIADNSKSARTSGTFICSGATRPTANYALGIRNTMNQPLEVSVNVQQTDPTSPLNTIIFFPGNDVKFTIGAGQTRNINIVIELVREAKRGQYIYTARVTGGGGPGELYGHPQLFYFNVE